MNNTTVKRGIGAVVLALIAAALLAFLLKDKAAQRQEVVEIALPGAAGGVETTSQPARLPTLTTDNSGNGDVIANAGNGIGENTDGTAQAVSIVGSNSSDGTDGTIIASAAAVGTGVADTVSKEMDFSVKPKTAKASGEFLDLDLVNNGQAANTTASAPKATSQQDTASSNNDSDTDQGIVIASTKPKSTARANVVQPRLVGEKRAAPVKSASTAKVIIKKKPAKANTQSQPVVTTSQAKNGYAIQLLATSSLSRANNLKNVMAGEGYPTYVTKVLQNGKTLYRVRIGQYTTKAQALQVQTAMKRRYKKNTNVNRSAIVAR